MVPRTGLMSSNFFKKNLAKYSQQSEASPPSPGQPAKIQPHLYSENTLFYNGLRLQRVWLERIDCLETKILGSTTWMKPVHIFTVRKRSCGKVMFSQACVSDTSPRADTPGQIPPWQADTPHPSRRLLQRTARILLECILV